MRMSHSLRDIYSEETNKGFYKDKKTENESSVFFETSLKRTASIITFKNGNSLLMTPKPESVGFDKTYEYLVRLWNNNVKTIAVLLERHEEKGLINIYEDNNFEVLHFPIKDFDVPQDMRKLSHFLHILRQRLSRHSVAIHCHGGKGRTGLVTACLFVQMGMDPQKAIDYVRKHRPGTIETMDQEIFIYDFAIFESANESITY